MSKETLELIRGVAQACADAYDGAVDEKGEPLKIGLKREEGHCVYDSRVMDGFKCRMEGNILVITYQSDIKLKDVYAGNFENDIEATIGDIASFIKTRYKKNTGNSLSLTPEDEADILVQSTSRVRVFVNATKRFKIGGMKNIDEKLKPSEDRLESQFKNFLDQGGWGTKAKSDLRKNN